MKYTENLSLKKPESTDFYNVDDFNENADKVDTEIKDMKDKLDGWKVNDQTPTYTEASTLTALTSGEKISVAFGKIAKAVSTLISHIATAASTTVAGHVKFGTTAGTACQGNDSRLSDSRTPKAHASTGTGYGAGTTSNYGHVKLTSSSAVTDTTGLALAATEKNASISGTLANLIASISNELSSFQDYIKLTMDNGITNLNNILWDSAYCFDKTSAVSNTPNNNTNGFIFTKAYNAGSGNFFIEQTFVDGIGRRHFRTCWYGSWSGWREMYNSEYPQIRFESVSFANTSVAANGGAAITVNKSVDGYGMVGMAALITGNMYLVPSQYYINGNNQFNIVLKNVSSSSQSTISGAVTLIYKKL